MAATCRGCGVELVWALTPSGAKAPMEPAADEAANTLMLKPRLFGDYLAVTLTGESLERARDNGLPLHYNHFATCPERQKFGKAAEQSEQEHGSE